MRVRCETSAESRARARLTCIEVVPRARAVEPVSEEVGEDLAAQTLSRAPFVLDVRAQRWVLRELGDLRERVADREEDAVDLRVLVCSGRSLGSVTRAESRGR